MIAEDQSGRWVFVSHSYILMIYVCSVLTFRPGRPHSQVYQVSFLLVLPSVDKRLGYHCMGSSHK